MDKIERIRGVASPKDIFVKDEKKNLPKLCNISMLFGSEAWHPRKKEIPIMERIEKAIIKAMCGVK